MWDPSSAPSNFKLTIAFNKNISAEAYARARDQVLLTPDVTLKAEDVAARTLDTNFNDAIKAAVEKIPGVTGTEKIRISGFNGGGGCIR